MKMKMITTTRQVGFVAIVDITGQIVLGKESASLRDLVSDLLSKGHNNVFQNTVFDIRDDEAAAVRSFGKSAAATA